ncbi:hypothetical protein [Candidatus Nardonella dryophthoridicola]
MIEMKINNIILDKSGFKYHGRIKELYEIIKNKKLIY